MCNIQSKELHRTDILYELKRIFITALQNPNFASDITEYIKQEIYGYGCIEYISVDINGVIEIKVKIFSEEIYNDKIKFSTPIMHIQLVISEYCYQCIYNNNSNFWSLINEIANKNNIPLYSYDTNTVSDIIKHELFSVLCPVIGQEVRIFRIIFSNQ